MLVPISWHLPSCSFSLKFNKKAKFHTLTRSHLL